MTSIENKEVHPCKSSEDTGESFAREVKNDVCQVSDVDEYDHDGHASQLNMLNGERELF